MAPSSRKLLQGHTSATKRTRAGRLRRWFVVAVCIVSCVGGAPGSPTRIIGSATSAVTDEASFTGGTLQLSAVKLYNPVRWEDAQTHNVLPFTFGIPRELRVTMGNAGNGTAVLSMAGASSGNVECTYRGGSHVPHPTTPTEIQDGARYFLERCTPRHSAGNAVTASSFHLHVAEGDAEHVLGVTGASVTLARPKSTGIFPIALPPRPFPPFQVSNPAGILEGRSQIRANGEFSYDIPVPVPPGRAGLQPTLSLQYRSRGGDGLLGVGWRLAGIPEIRRCPSTIATEGYTDGIHFNIQDRFCLDGAKLIAIHGEYGADRTEYRTEEDSFQRIISYGPTGAPSHFRVWARDGRILEFVDPFENPDATGFASIGAIATHVWLLSEISNRSGSKIRFAYHVGDRDHPLHTPEPIPSEILYVRDAKAGTELQRAIRFEYEDRPDPSVEWVAGLPLTRKQRLTGIRTYVGWGSASVSPVAELRLEYAQSSRTNRTLLAAVTRCDGGQATFGAEPVCLQPKLFGWDTEPSRPAWTVVLDALNPDLQAPNVKARATRAIVADLDGDGRDDVVYQIPSTWPKMAERVRYGQVGSLTQPFTLTSPYTDWDLPSSRAVDVDGDGKTEILAWVFDIPTRRGGFQLHGADRPTLRFFAVGPFFSSFPKGDGSFPGRIDFMDADGGGRLDAFAGKMVHPNVESSNVIFYRNQGGKFATPSDTGQRYCEGGQTFPRAVDLTGDGRGMWLLSQCPTRASGALHAARIDRAGNLSVTDENVNLAVPGSMSEFVLADLNGDGLKDAVFPFFPEPAPGAPAGPVTDIKVRWNTGRGFGPAEILRDPHASAFGFDVRTGWDSGLRVADVNGDGREDLIQFVSAAGGAQTGIWVFETQHVNPNDRMAFHSYKVSNDPGRLDLTYGWKSANVGDFDGDGMVDILAILNQPVSTFRTYLNTNLRPDLLTLIADSKAISSFHRSFTSERIVYSTQWDDAREPDVNARAATYPQRSIKRGIVVVKEHYATTDGLENRTLYSYADPRADMLGRGFLGFSVQRIFDESRNTKTELHFDLDTRDGTIYPFAGRPVYQSEVLTDTTPTFYERTKTTTIHYNLSRSLASALVYTVMPLDSDVVTTEKRSGTTQTLRHDVLIQRWDGYGNETSRFEITDEGENTVRTAFEHDANAELRDGWLVNLPAQRRVTSFAAGFVVARERLTRYAHDASGQLRDVFIEPPDEDDSEGDDSVRQHLHYDYTRGVMTDVRATAAGVRPRDIHIEYDNDVVHPRRITDSLGHATRVFVDPGLGVTTQRVNANGVSTWYSYDGFGRLRREANEGGAAHSLDHAETPRGGFEISKHVAGGGDSIQHFNSRGQLIGESSLTLDVRWASTALTYDKLGRLVRRSRPILESARPVLIYGALSGTTFVYDLLDRVVRTTTPDNRSVSFSYNGRTTASYDELNHQVTSVADSLGRVVERHETVSGLGTRSSVFRYGPFGVLAGISHADRILGQRPHHTEQTFTYDVLGRRTQLTDPDAGSRSFTFNAFGEVTEERDAAARAVVYERDGLGRVVSRTDDRGAALYIWDTALHGVGSLAAARSADGILTRFAYDVAGRQERKTTTVAGVDYSMTRGYDHAGRLAWKGFPVSGGPFHVSYKYSNGELSSVTTLADDHVYFAITAKNADGRLERVQYANGVSEQHAYDPATGRLVNREVVNAAGTVLLHQSHSYDWRGLLATRSAAASGASETFGYDDARRLIRHAVNADVRQYAYDLRGNLWQATQNGTIDYSAQFTGCPVAMPPHQPCSTSERLGVFDGHSTLTYDENGRQTRARFLGVNMPLDAQAEDLRTLEFNSFDLPWLVSHSASINGAIEGRESLEVSYDAFGVRTLQRSYRDVSPPIPPDVNPDAKQVYIGDEFEAREQLGVVTQHAFIGGPEGITVEVVFDAAGGETLTRHLHQDLLGSVDLTTLGANPSEATVEAKHRYEAYGARLTPSGSRQVGTVGAPSTRGFTGHYHDDSFGLINMQGRMYDPWQRRFLTPDPVSVHAAGSHHLRSERPSTDQISSLGALPSAGLQARNGSPAALQGAPGGSSPGMSDGTFGQGGRALGLGAFDGLRLATAGCTPRGGLGLCQCRDGALVGRVQPLFVCLQQSHELRRPERILSGLRCHRRRNRDCRRFRNHIRVRRCCDAEGSTS